MMSFENKNKEIYKLSVENNVIVSPQTDLEYIHFIIDDEHKGKELVIADKFMYKSKTVKQISFDNSINVVSIGTKFLYKSSIEFLIINSFVNLKYIGDNFLHKCKKLRIFNMDELEKCNAHGYNFITKCPNLIEY